MTTPGLPMPETKTPSDEPEAPKILFLQDGCEDPRCMCRPEEYEGVTWCCDQINANDSKYIRFDVYETDLAAAQASIAEVTRENESLPGLEKFLGLTKGELDQDMIAFLRRDGRLAALRKYHTAGIVRALCAMTLDAEALVASLSEALREAKQAPDQLERRLSWLEDTFRHCPHTVIRHNDDADEEDGRGPVPLGWSIWIDGCAPLHITAQTFPDLIDACLAWSKDDDL